MAKAFSDCIYALLQANETQASTLDKIEELVSDERGREVVNLLIHHGLIKRDYITLRIIIERLRSNPAYLLLIKSDNSQPDIEGGYFSQRSAPVVMRVVITAILNKAGIDFLKYLEEVGYVFPQSGTVSACVVSDRFDLLTYFTDRGFPITKEHEKLL